MHKDLNLDSYDFELPVELIAQEPNPLRHGSRLLVYHEQSGEIIHSHFSELPKFLSPSDTLVFNQSQVFPCRINANKTSGGKIELFFLSLQPEANGNYRCLIRSNGKKNIGDEYLINETKVKVEKNCEQYFEVSLPKEFKLEEYLEDHGHVPIPPYIRKGEDKKEDRENYQTLFAKVKGSTAAPTAGLHFSDELLNELENKGISKAFVTLHVGLGTFKPVVTENILEHQMHSEQYFVDNENIEQLNNSKSLIAVGTTSLRVLESLKSNGSYPKMQGWDSTNIFLHPGKNVESIKGMVTNFHLPKSSLIMLVSTLIGREKTLELYKGAIKKKYRFFSYGDGMLILRKGWNK